MTCVVSTPSLAVGTLTPLHLTNTRLCYNKSHLSGTKTTDLLGFANLANSFSLIYRSHAESCPSSASSPVPQSSTLPADISKSKWHYVMTTQSRTLQKGLPWPLRPWLLPSPPPLLPENLRPRAAFILPMSCCSSCLSMCMMQQVCHS